MPVTHGSSPSPERAAVPFVMSLPAIGELAAKAPEGSPLSHALHRAEAEHREPRFITASFDNRL